VVDDSEFTRELVVDVFEKMGLEVIEAEDGRRGVDRFKAEAPDLVFTDLDMPMLDGFGLIQEIRGLGSEVPIIVFTTRGTDEARQRALDLGADIFLLKTEFRERKLHNIVDKYVEITVDP
jgi:CheY-like chemotaxis protein